MNRCNEEGKDANVKKGVNVNKKVRNDIFFC